MRIDILSLFSGPSDVEISSHAGCAHKHPASQDLLFWVEQTHTEIQAIYQ
jgi:hypothetical protein